MSNRHTNINKLIKQGMQGGDEDYSSQQEPQLSKQEWGMIDTLMDMFALSENDALKYFQNEDYDFDRTVQKIKKNKQKQKEKQEKKIKEQQKQQELKQQRLRQQKRKKQEQEKALQSETKQIKAPEVGRRKSSQDEPIRKNSQVVEQYTKDHYNSEYPSIGKAKQSPSNTISVVVVGHVDSGKSTLLGVLMKDAAFIDSKEVHKNEKQSKIIGKESFKDAWVTDSTEQERARGVTIDIGVRKITIKDKSVVFLDSPGHRDFIPNMITGAAQADYAILVIDCDNFQSSFQGGGQTKEHAYIVRSLGVLKLIVAMNKMDRVNWSPERFTMIHKKLSHYLLTIGFPEDSVAFIPISATFGQNVTNKKIHKFQAGFTKYSQSLLQMISQLPIPPRPIDKPFRMTITNVYDSQFGKLKGHCLSGRVQGGVIQQHNKLVILPLDTQCLVKDIIVGQQKVKQAAVGDSIDIQIKMLQETTFQSIKAGMVLSSLMFAIPVSQKIVVQALALDLEVPVLRGTQVMVYIATNRCPGRITRINYIFNPSDGTIKKKNPKCLHAHDCAQIQVQLSQKMCVELFSNYKVFGRVIIREKKDTLFVGTIKMIK